jgi:CO dehydrogenase/acetyl-CoA synthase beta subunit
MLDGSHLAPREELDGNAPLAQDRDVKASAIHLPRVRDYVAQKKQQGREVREIECDTGGERLVAGLPVRVGPDAEKGIILKEDTFVELGNPSAGSCSFVVWSDELSAVADGRITCIGPDIQRSGGQSLPFGQVMIVSGTELEQEHYPQLESTQYTSDQIEGYMLRSLPRRVWSRVSNDAAAKGFCFETLGRALMSVFRWRNPLVEATEVIFVTSSKEDVVQLDAIGADVRKFSGELKKLVRQQDESYECTEYDCDTCDDKPVCDSVREWTRVRRKKTAEAPADASRS